MALVDQRLGELRMPYFFIRRQIPFRYWIRDYRPGKGLPPWWHTFRSLEDLMPGRDLDLDAICDGIMYGKEALAYGT